jgi:hypothetical protein
MLKSFVLINLSSFRKDMLQYLSDSIGKLEMIEDKQAAAKDVAMSASHHRNRPVLLPSMCRCQAFNVTAQLLHQPFLKVQ